MFSSISARIYNLYFNLWPMLHHFAKWKFTEWVLKCLPLQHRSRERYARMQKKHSAQCRSFHKSSQLTAKMFRSRRPGVADSGVQAVLSYGQDLRSPKIHVFVPLKWTDSNKRNKEISNCIQINISNNLFEYFYILSEDPDVSKSYPDYTIELDHRPTFSDWFSCCAKLPKSDICVLMNADIMLDKSFSKLRRLSLIQSNVFVALSRFEYEYKMNIVRPHLNPKMSQDLWALRAGAGLNKLHHCQIPIGMQGCDNKIAYILWDQGFQISNPMFEISIIHMHETGRRKYRADECLLDGAMAKVWPGPLEAPGSEVEVWGDNVPIDEICSSSSL